MHTLDRNKPFGTVCGSTDGVVYEQDGAFFDSQGREVGGKRASAPAVEVPAPHAEVDAQVEQQIGIDVDGDGKVDIHVKGGKVRKARK